MKLTTLHATRRGSWARRGKRRGRKGWKREQKITGDCGSRGCERDNREWDSRARYVATALQSPRSALISHGEPRGLLFVFSEKRAPTAAPHTIRKDARVTPGAKEAQPLSTGGLSRGKRPRQGLLTAGLPGVVGGGGQGRLLLALAPWHGQASRFSRRGWKAREFAAFSRNSDSRLFPVPPMPFRSRGETCASCYATCAVMQARSSPLSRVFTFWKWASPRFHAQIDSRDYCGAGQSMMETLRFL